MEWTKEDHGLPARSENLNVAEMACYSADTQQGLRVSPAPFDTGVIMVVSIAQFAGASMEVEGRILRSLLPHSRLNTASKEALPASARHG